jgi:NADPH-dependent curcumin reductase CurA
MNLLSSREIRLERRPVGSPVLEDFSLHTVEVPAPAEGLVRVRNLWMSVDPYMGGRLYDNHDSYVPPYRLNHPLDGGAVGVVVDSADSQFKPGDIVFSQYGWREIYNAPAKRLRRIDTDGLPPEAFLGIAGVTGRTAYVGLFSIGQIKAGETVYVSAAAGAVGSAAVQMAKIAGCTVIGSAGGKEKCDYLRSIGADHVIDYKSEDLEAALKAAAPEGIDFYFDNVGGPQLEAALNAMKTFGRIALCGMISQYNESGVSGPGNIVQILAKRLTVRGFILGDHEDERPAFERDVRDWIKSGQLKWQQTVEHGIANAPAAFLKLFKGGNIGKMVVKLSD